MTERRAFPLPPGKALVANRDGTMGLQWLTWFGALASWVQRVRVVETAIDWPSIPAGTKAWADVTITGARLGDFAAASLDPTHENLEVTAQVRADDTVRVWVTNNDAGAVDLAAGTTRIRVEKAR